MSSVLTSIFESRPFYNWRMARRSGIFAVGGLLAAITAGAFFMMRPDGHLAMLGLAPELAFAGFFALLALAALLWWRFTSLQDEMFRRVQNYSSGWGATISVAVTIVWGVANAMTVAPPIDPVAPLLSFAIAKSFFWTAATRKWL